MGVEVEIKAHVDDYPALTARLREIGTFGREYVKEDYYFSRSPTPKGARFRLRFDDGEWICTAKQKTLVDGVEQNVEREFSVSDGGAFRRFAEDLGFSVVVEKRKHGSSWLVDDVVVEVSSVNEIGRFVELELVLPDDSSETDLVSARTRLHTLLERVGISRDRIETRPYTQMIYENVSSTGKTARASV
ncbi:MAG: class IV adenylate cyclase [Spirochaeta sp.]|jgi:adenylate cyclase class 2|nr:class IV adenylate cyclase [Spirochaeta sp.]